MNTVYSSKKKRGTKYVFFIGGLDEGGAERVLSVLANHITFEDGKTEILTYYDRNIFYDINSDISIKSVERQTGTRNTIKNIFWMRKYLRKEAKVVISFLAPFNILLLISLFGTSVPTIVADRNDPRFVPEGKQKRLIRDCIYLLANKIIVQTKHNKEYFGRTIQKKTEIIFNPVDIGEAGGQAIKTEKKNKIVTVGRLMPQKNHELLIQAFCEVHKIYPMYQLDIYGDGENRKNLHDLILQSKAQDYINLNGVTNNVVESIADAKIFVLSSYYEGMPNALIEAMCIGLPVISTKVSGATDVILDQVNGILVEQDDKKGLVDSMLYLLSNDTIRCEMARRATEVSQITDVTNIVHTWKNVISKTISKNTEG